MLSSITVAKWTWLGFSLFCCLMRLWRNNAVRSCLSAVQSSGGLRVRSSLSLLSRLLDTSAGTRELLSPFYVWSLLDIISDEKVNKCWHDRLDTNYRLRNILYKGRLSHCIAENLKTTVSIILYFLQLYSSYFDKNVLLLKKHKVWRHGKLHINWSRILKSCYCSSGLHTFSIYHFTIQQFKMVIIRRLVIVVSPCHRIITSLDRFISGGSL